MMLSDLQNKDIINVADGKKIGSIIDVVIDREGRITELNIQKRKFIFFTGGTSKVRWSQIDKIGKDVILVNVSV